MDPSSLPQRFREQFGPGGKALLVSAPGRVNLIGEHTDYHDGFVLPSAIERHVQALGRLRQDDVVELHSQTFHGSHRFRLGEPMGAAGGWARRAEGILRSVCAALPAARGMEVVMDADLPVGGGLSSSAASMAALGELAARLHGVTLDRKELARTIQRAEHTYAGVKCGLMDPLAILLGRAGHAVLIDCRSLATALVSLPKAWALVVLDTGVRHDLASSEYNRRQQECAQVLQQLALRHPEVKSLRDATWEQLDEVAPSADPVGLRRCRHVLAENERVHAAHRALAAAQGAEVRKLFLASHESLRRDYEVSCPELDWLVEAAQAAPGVVASRMTGGGFGGSTVNLVEREKTDAFVAGALERYRRLGGRGGQAIVTAASDGVRVSEV